MDAYRQPPPAPRRAPRAPALARLDAWLRGSARRYRPCDVCGRRRHRCKDNRCFRIRFERMLVGQVVPFIADLVALEENLRYAELEGWEEQTSRRASKGHRNFDRVLVLEAEPRRTRSL